MLAFQSHFPPDELPLILIEHSSIFLLPSSSNSCGSIPPCAPQGGGILINSNFRQQTVGIPTCLLVQTTYQTYIPINFGSALPSAIPSGCNKSAMDAVYWQQCRISCNYFYLKHMTAQTCCIGIQSMTIRLS